MEKDGIFNTDLNTLIGEDTPIEVDGVGEGVIIPAEPSKEKETAEKHEDNEEEGLIDLEKDDEEVASVYQNES